MAEKGKVVEVTDSNFDVEVLKGSSPTLVDFWAVWCAPCRAVAPIVEELAEAYNGRVKFVKLNVDENPATSSAFGIRSIPTLLLFKGGKVVSQEIGAVPKARIEDMVKRAL